MTDLSIVIPARNEIFLGRTIDDIFEHTEMDTEVIAVCDGYWPDPPLEDYNRLTVIHFSSSVGQREAINAGVGISKAKYILKADAHCAFAQGFDRVLLKDIQEDWTIVPLMRNLHAFDWVCEEGHRRYQGPSGPCLECGKPTQMDVVWIAKTSPVSRSYCFDSEPHFQYFAEYSKRPEGQGRLTETMSLQGSCFMMTKERFQKLNVCDPAFGSWGSQGIEVACKTWLSGGRCIVDQDTWYGHMFRTQGGDFGFPYPISGRQVEYAKAHAKDLFFNNKWDGQIYPLSWLVEKFWPVRGWTQADLDQLKDVEQRNNILY